jgi:hypothetical protein
LDAAKAAGMAIYLNWYGGAGGTIFGNGSGTQVGAVDVSGNASFIGTLAITGAITQNGNQVLHAGNVATYALPISGGTLTGTLNGTIGSFSTKVLSSRFHDSGDAFLFRSGSGAGTTRHINLADSTSDPSSVGSATGITCGERSDNAAYYMIYVKAPYNNGSSTHSRLVLGWHTGMEIGASATYGGVRFMTDSPGVSTSEIFSVGKGDSNVRVTNTLYVGGNVGIGVATPLYKLDVSGTIRFSSLTSGTSTTCLVLESNGEVRTKVNAASSGSSGSSGTSGAAGGAGPPGPPGTTGGVGSSGSSGTSGSNGGAGPPGPPGPPGGSGGSGSSGTSGGTGPAGPTGPTGPTGPSGSANASGTTGKMAKFTGSTSLGDSNITVTGTGIQLPSTPASNSPSDIDFNASYASAAGIPARQMIKLYYDGSSCYGFGVSGGQLEMMAYSGGIHAFYNGTSLVAQFNASGNLGVGVTPSSYKVDVNGNVHAVGFPTSSDVRFKKNITPIENALSKVLKLRGVKYEWNEFINNTRDGYDLNSPIIGFIAQELELIVPELVSKWKLNEECQDARAVDYPRVVVLLTEAIKEQQTQINDLKTRISILENK